MNSNENQNSKSITIDLENLRQKYSNLLIKYKGAVTDYVNYLNVQSQQCSDLSANNTNCKNNEQLVSIQGKAFNGTGSAGQSTATTLQKCMVECANSETCSGATFISNKCQLRIGDSPIVPSSQDSYAIIPKGKELLLNVEDINQQLLDVNKELVNKIKVTEPVYYEINNDNALKNLELIQTYEKLLEERRNIVKLLNEYETLDNTENQTQININQNYYLYVLLFILAFVVVMLLYKMFSSGNISSVQAQPPAPVSVN